MKHLGVTENTDAVVQFFKDTSEECMKIASNSPAANSMFDIVFCNRYEHQQTEFSYTYIFSFNIPDCMFSRKLYISVSNMRKTSGHFSSLLGETISPLSGKSLQDLSRIACFQKCSGLWIQHFYVVLSLIYNLLSGFYAAGAKPAYLICLSRYSCLFWVATPYPDSQRT